MSLTRRPALDSSPPSSVSSRNTVRSESFQAVWKLYCKHCNVLWSSRGMEAVVMARPAIRCFSTDLPPLGCDVVHQPVAPAIESMIVDSGCHTCSSLVHHARRFDLAPSGPCDCHVQDIACLGCGNLVGYYIHRPCFRCLAQRLRIKQRGFQHLWTFYQDNVVSVQRENEFGEPVGWEELPVPPLPTATSIIRPIEAAEPSLGEQTNSRSIHQVAQDTSSVQTPGRRNNAATVASADNNMGGRANWLLNMSQRLAAERVLHNPRAGREARQEAMRTLSSLREHGWTSPSNADSSSDEEPATGVRPAVLDPTPPRQSTQTRAPLYYNNRVSSTGPTQTLRQDEVMDPVCPAKPRALSGPPPAGLSNWLFQVGIDCMVKWEEVTLAR
ncbi:hypothetical protein GGI25_004332 [Coemansia spiralis]|uniref:Uncharacterized protein n=2 Tax=Coemansia TaxID=4863 RepID=A0A9W8G595_9FUNG|nr:hypothetical protein EDC05_003072 [Coemansia umbellata]KAJ2621417.1 hypothetical protein GGI26_004099 [Coemansia sp. RSA 1358]KAJ2674392.1 hypothetical protein GGI25_004332 [Coemansia spiralis]